MTEEQAMRDALHGEALEAIEGIVGDRMQRDPVESPTTAFDVFIDNHLASNPDQGPVTQEPDEE
jgi:hypothetical protein